MNRKTFIESQGATCRNWNWSWSFVNHEARFIIFGEWDRNIENGHPVILADDWELNSKGKKKPGYSQAKEHIELIGTQQYGLLTFPMQNIGAHENGLAKIGKFTPILTEKKLVRSGKNWIAHPNDNDSQGYDESMQGKGFVEGSAFSITVNAYERNPIARALCLKYYGHSCRVCDFDFSRVYGELGDKYIHVHHVVPLSKIGKQYKVNPIKDLIPVCANCHAMIHRKNPSLSVKQLKKLMSNLKRR